MGGWRNPIKNFISERECFRILGKFMEWRRDEEQWTTDDQVKVKRILGFYGATVSCCPSCST